MEYLTRLEEILLLAVIRLKNNAYGVTIRNSIKEVTGQNLTFGALYVSLDKLVKKGYLKKFSGDPSPERGGRSKIFYTLTEEGTEALQQTRSLNNSLWDGIPDLGYNK